MKRFIALVAVFVLLATGLFANHFVREMDSYFILTVDKDNIADCFEYMQQTGQIGIWCGKDDNCFVIIERIGTKIKPTIVRWVICAGEHGEQFVVATKKGDVNCPVCGGRAFMAKWFFCQSCGFSSIGISSPEDNGKCPICGK